MKAKAVFRAQRDGHHLGTAGADNPFVSGIHRIAHQNLLTRLGHAQ